MHTHKHIHTHMYTHIHGCTYTETHLWSLSLVHVHIHSLNCRERTNRFKKKNYVSSYCCHYCCSRWLSRKDSPQPSSTHQACVVLSYYKWHHYPLATVNQQSCCHAMECTYFLWIKTFLHGGRGGLGRCRNPTKQVSGRLWNLHDLGNTESDKNHKSPP